MRNFYDMPDGSRQTTGSAWPAYERRLLQVVTLAYWTPCCVADIWLLSRGGRLAASFVFWLLFREAIVFLALWFVAAAANGLMRGSRVPADPTRRRLSWKDIKGYVAPTRANRGQ